MKHLHGPSGTGEPPPPFWRAIGPFLPPGAGTWAARSIAYFHRNAVGTSLLVLGAWAAIGTAVTLLTARPRRQPGREPRRRDGKLAVTG
ncbi:hypothetical protein [Streptomyces sp. NPDC056144]|uniref:hypothetical protein n=1 Tax=unclassified Streptomyces TaxID=2593676 RepID=UPI0035DDC2F1